MELEVEIIPVEKFEVRIKGISIGEFHRESAWEGMVKIKSENGVIIFEDTRSLMDKMFDSLLNAEKESGFAVLKISPSLIPTELKK